MQSSIESRKETVLREVVVIMEKQPPEEEAAAFKEMLLEEKTEVVWYTKEREWELEKILAVLDIKAESEEEKRAKKGILFLSDNKHICSLAVEAGCSCAACITEKNKGESFEGVRYAVEKLGEIDYRYLERVCRRYAKLPWEIRRTKRCIIREMITEDVPSFYEIYKEPSITMYMEGLFPTKEQEIAYVEDYIKNVYEFFEYGLWTVVEKESGQIIGRAGISWCGETNEVELGYVIAVPFQRQGYAYEVCSAVLQYAKEELEIEEVAAYIKKENTASVALCRKMGFTAAGEILLRKGHYEKYIKKL